MIGANGPGIRTIHLGTGGRGRWPIEQIRERDDYESVALVDINEDHLRAAREATGLGAESCFDSLEAALGAVEADAVVVITPPDLHFEQCLQAVRAGKHVLVEKPFTKNLTQARQIVKEADAAGLAVAVCQQRQLQPLPTTLRRLIRDRVYGVPELGLMTKFSWRPGTHHSRGDHHAYLWERGIHDLDEIIFYLDARPIRLWAHSFNPSWSPYRGSGGFHGWVEFDNGMTFGLLCTFAAHASGSSLRLECSGATIEQVGTGLRVQVPGAEEPLEVALDESEGEAGLLDGFRRYVEKGAEPSFSGRNNLVTVGLVEALGAGGRPRAGVELRGIRGVSLLGQALVPTDERRFRGR